MTDMTAPSFEADIRALFRERDRGAMLHVFDLCPTTTSRRTPTGSSPPSAAAQCPATASGRRTRGTEFARKLLGTTRTSDFATVLLTPSHERVTAEMHCVAMRNDERVIGMFGLIELDRPHAASPSQRSDLTPRQDEVLQALARGLSTKQIARELAISSVTGRNHVSGVLRALGAHSRLEAVSRGRARELIRDAWRAHKGDGQASDDAVRATADAGLTFDGGEG